MVVQSLPLVQVGTPHAAVNLNPMSGLNVVTSHGSNVAVQGITPQGLVSLISLLQSLQQEQGGQPGKKKWSYDDPDAWADLYSTCGGFNQSPIDIDTRRSQPFNYKRPIQFINYNTVEGEWSNDGHSVRFDLSDGSSARLIGGPLNNAYKLLQFHLHWGSGSMQGSEHTINGKATAAELHLVHMNEKYDSLEEALKNDDGLAVVGILLTNDAAQDVPWFKTISTAARSRVVRNEGSKLPGRFNLESIVRELALQSNSDDLTYFSYEGSLTTPPCSEVVSWIVSKKTLSISPNQLTSLQSLRFDDGSTMVDNFRPIQDRNERVVISVCH